MQTAVQDTTKNWHLELREIFVQTSNRDGIIEDVRLNVTKNVRAFFDQQRVCKCNKKFVLYYD